jgi:glucose-1-phosphate adenylyltransferase
VIFADTAVRTGATVTRAIVDSGCELQDGAQVGDDSAALDDPTAVAMIGRECVVGSIVEPGGSLAPESTA